MEEIIEILRQRKSLSDKLKDFAQKQQDALKLTRGGSTAKDISQDMIPIITELSLSWEKEQDYLKKRNISTIEELVEKDCSPSEKDEVNNLLRKIKMILKDLERISEVNKKLLAKNMEYVGFTINVLNQVVADVTYAPQGNIGTEPLRGKKMFDQSV